MSELHEALKQLGPAVWSDVPTSDKELQTWTTNIFSAAQVIIDSVPVPAADDAAQKSSAPPTRKARSASEVSLSSERSRTPPPDHVKLQKEWGKAMKIKASDNPLGLSVYKLSGKGGRGSWFARHSIHEGIGFMKFKKSLEMEFEKSLAEEGPPGTGNVRGIGGEERVEQIKVDKALVEVYRLSAQFPGPTAPRDFVTLLVTSDKALTADSAADKTSSPALSPRHYMVISKPCDHPKTQPKQGMVRGFYESIEFIREVPRKPKVSQSSVDVASSKETANTGQESSDADDNPVEWLMITRSDPGGGIPRFLVERGTPSSICADAVKFVDWACANDDVVVPQSLSDTELQSARPAARRQSYQSWRGRSVVAIAETGDGDQETSSQEVERNVAVSETDTQQYQGIFGAVSGAAASLLPQAVLNHFPGSHAQTPGVEAPASNNNQRAAVTGIHGDNRSIKSTTSFASAEEHWSSSSLGQEGEVTSLESFAPKSPTQSKESLHHEKMLQKIKDRRQALHDKFAAAQAKYDKSRAEQMEKDSEQSSKAIEKHERELKKHEEKFQKELDKLEQKQEKERLKMVERHRKEADRDEKFKLARERDEARQERDLLKKEVESLQKMVQDLQKENATLVMKLGRSSASLDGTGGGIRSRGSSISRKEKKEKIADGTDPNLAVAGAAASLRGK